MPKVKIYSTTWCAYCKAQKKFLDEQKVKYTDVDVEQDPEAAQEMVQLSGQMGVPYTVVTRDDGSTAAAVGFDQEFLKKELSLK